LKRLSRILVLLILLISISKGLKAYSEYQSLDGIKKTYSPKCLLQQPGELSFEKTKNTLIEIFTGIYNMKDKRFKQIYDGYGFIYGLSFLRKLYNLNRHHFYLSLNIKSYTKKGKSTVTEKDTKLTLRPISLGGAYMFVTKRVIPMAEIGVDYYPYKEKSILHSTSGTAWGWHLKGGILFPLNILKSLKGKIYFRYSEAKTIENDLEVNLGGIEYGIGMIYEFNLF